MHSALWLDKTEGLAVTFMKVYFLLRAAGGEQRHRHTGDDRQGRGREEELRMTEAK